MVIITALHDIMRAIIQKMKKAGLTNYLNTIKLEKSSRSSAFLFLGVDRLVALYHVAYVVSN
jgi:hypothetical protein